jgi:hypothetical protein
MISQHLRSPNARAHARVRVVVFCCTYELARARARCTVLYGFVRMRPPMPLGQEGGQ